MSLTRTIDYVKSNFRVCKEVKRVKNSHLNYLEVDKLSILINFVALQNQKSDIPAEKQTRLQHVCHCLFWSHFFTTTAIFHYTCMCALAGMRLL